MCWRLCAGIVLLLAACDGAPRTPSREELLDRATTQELLNAMTVATAKMEEVHGKVQRDLVAAVNGMEPGADRAETLKTFRGMCAEGEYDHLSDFSPAFAELASRGSGAEARRIEATFRANMRRICDESWRNVH